MSNEKQVIANAQAEVTRRREAHEDALEGAAVPGSTVYVLHDGRRGWMHGEAGVVVSADTEWAEVQFPGRGLLRFKLERLSRQRDGQDCMHGRWALNMAAAYTRTER